MRRKLSYLALALLIPLGFVSCSQEQEQVLRIATRSTSDESVIEDFTDDFTLELWSTTLNAKHETHSMTYTDGTGWNTAKSSIPCHRRISLIRRP